MFFRDNNDNVHGLSTFGWLLLLNSSFPILHPKQCHGYLFNVVPC